MPVSSTWQHVKPRLAPAIYTDKETYRQTDRLGAAFPPGPSVDGQTDRLAHDHPNPTSLMETKQVEGTRTPHLPAVAGPRKAPTVRQLLAANLLDEGAVWPDTQLPRNLHPQPHSLAFEDHLLRSTTSDARRTHLWVQAEETTAPPAAMRTNASRQEKMGGGIRGAAPTPGKIASAPCLCVRAAFLEENGVLHAAQDVQRLFLYWFELFMLECEYPSVVMVNRGPASTREWPHPATHSRPPPPQGQQHRVHGLLSRSHCKNFGMIGLDLFVSHSRFNLRIVA
jgi:hypothetical protein